MSCRSLKIIILLPFFIIFPLTIYAEDELPVFWQKVEEIKFKPTSAFLGPDGRLWFSSESDGLFVKDGDQWLSYNTENSGLQTNRTFTCVVDSSGTVWIGTTEGLVRFDGSNWTVYNTFNSGISDNYVRHIAIDEKGVVWCANILEISYFDGTKWSVYPLYEEQGMGVRCLATDHDYLLIGSTEGRVGLCRYDGTEFIKSATNLKFDDVSSICVDENGDIYVGTNGYINGAPLSSAFRTGQQIISMKIDSNGNLWAVSKYRIWCFDGNSWCMIRWWSIDAGISDPYGSNVIYFLTFDSENTLWIASKMGVYSLKAPIISLSEFEKEMYTPGETVNINWVSTQFYPIDLQYSINNGDWFTIVENIDSHLGSYQWIPPDSLIYDTYLKREIKVRIIVADDDVYLPNSSTSFTLGINPGEALTRFSYYREGIPESQVTCFTEDTSDNLWVGMDPGLCMYNGLSWEVFSLGDIDTLFADPVNQTILDIETDAEDKIWFALKAGLLRYDGKTWKTFFPGKYISHVAADRTGAVWIAAAENQTAARDSLFTLYRIKNDLIELVLTPWEDRIDGVSAMAVSPDDELFLFRSGMLVKYDGNDRDDWEDFTDAYFDPPRMPRKLVWDSYGELWTFDTVYPYDAYSFSFRINMWIHYNWSTIEAIDVMGSMNDLEVDGSGMIWFIINEQLHAFDYTRFYPYSSRYGWDMNNIYTIYIDRNNVKWLGGAGIIYRFDETLLPMSVDIESPEAFTLLQNYPNPFNVSTIISYTIQTRTDIRLTIYNITGQRVRTLVQGNCEPGTYIVVWDGTNEDGMTISSGIYFTSLSTGSGIQTRKMLYMK